MVLSWLLIVFFASPLLSRDPKDDRQHYEESIDILGSELAAL
jgi:hypothetical protein